MAFAAYLQVPKA